MKDLFRRLTLWENVKFFKGMCALFLSPMVCANPHLEVCNTYLSRMKSLSAHIQQVDPKGAVAEGTLYIQKPGCLRLIYQPKGSLELIANGKELIQYDGRTKQSDSVSLSSTPLSFLLHAEGRLQDYATIHNVMVCPKWIQILLSSKEDPESGKVKLVFQRTPFKLVRWILCDNQGNRTVVTLSQIHTNVPLDPKIFRMRSR
jgi:outer membrane lipoprotein-sorting protein